MRYAKIVDDKLVFTDAKKPVLVDGVYQLVDKTPEDLQGYKEYVEIADVAGENQYLVVELSETDTQVIKHTKAVNYTEEELREQEEYATQEQRKYIDSLSMTKAEFLILVTGLTKNSEKPVTLDSIEEMLQGDDDIRMRFVYANTVERNHPMLDGVSAMFGISPEYLDIIFTQKDELIYAIDNNIPLEGL